MEIKPNIFYLAVYEVDLVSADGKECRTYRFIANSIARAGKVVEEFLTDKTYHYTNSEDKQTDSDRRFFSGCEIAAIRSNRVNGLCAESIGEDPTYVSYKL